jgi:hypothetical protein
MILILNMLKTDKMVIIYLAMIHIIGNIPLNKQKILRKYLNIEFILKKWLLYSL